MHREIPMHPTGRHAIRIHLRALASASISVGGGKAHLSDTRTALRLKTPRPVRMFQPLP